MQTKIWTLISALRYTNREKFSSSVETLIQILDSIIIHKFPGINKRHRNVLNQLNVLSYLAKKIKKKQFYLKIISKLLLFWPYWMVLGNRRNIVQMPVYKVNPVINWNQSHSLCLGKFYIIRSQEKNLNQNRDSHLGPPDLNIIFM